MEMLAEMAPPMPTAREMGSMIIGGMKEREK